MSSARQNKKQRKGRNPHQHRERTVTTLTGDSDTVFSTTHHTTTNKSEDVPQGGSMPQPFNAFAFNNYPTYISQPHVTLPPGENDLEKLENLKQIIKSGQHELYTTVPNPIALAQLYLGDIDSNQQQDSGSSEDAASRPPRLQSKDPMRKAAAGTATFSNADEQAPQIRSSVGSSSTFSGVKTSNYPAEIKTHTTHESLGDKTTQTSNMDNNTPLSARISRANDNFEPPPYPEDYRPRELTQRDSVTTQHTNGSFPVSASGHDSRYYDPRDYDREREREAWDRERRNSDLRYGRDERRLSDPRRHEIDLYTSRRYDSNDEDRRRDERDRLNSRPPDERDRISPRIDGRDRGRYPPQRLDDHNYDRSRAYPDARHGPPIDTRAPPVDARLTSSPSQINPPSSSSTTMLPTGPAQRNGAEDRSSRPPPPTMPPFSQPQTALEEIETRAPTLEERISTRVPTLQERLSQPSMRGGPVPPQHSSGTANSTASTPGRQPTLEQRISQAPGGANASVTGSDALKRTTGSRDQRDKPLSGVDAPTGPARSPAANSAVAPLSTAVERGRSLNRDVNNNEPTSPDTPASTSGRYPSRADSVVRESGIGSHVKSSSVARGTSPAPGVAGNGGVGGGRHDIYNRSAPPPREASRERLPSVVPPPGANSYRPDEKNYPDRDRDRDRMDLDHSRYTERYSGRYSPSYDRDRARPPPNPAARTYSSPPQQPHAPYDDRDRRMPPPGSIRDYPPNLPYEYNREADRRRDWPSAEEDAYWKASRPAYPPLDRERYEREPHPSSTSLIPPPSRGAPGWETRDEHDSRRSGQMNIYPPPRSTSRDPPRPSYENRPYYDRPRYEPSATPNPHGHPQSAVALAASVRIRQRSPSPRRPGTSTVDDRPPLKRPRDDSYPTGPGTYTRPRETNSSTAPGRYPPDYEPRLPPPGERAEYRRPPEYPGSYDRSRSPASRSVAGAGYASSYRPDIRDDRRYMPPPGPQPR